MIYRCLCLLALVFSLSIPALGEYVDFCRWSNAGVHGGLDAIGLVPGAGEIADGANAAIYLAEGNRVDAGLSAAGMIPFAGWAATGGKVLRRATNAAAAGLEVRGLRPAAGTRVRPEGIPETWKVRPTESGGGAQYYNPANPNQNVRVMQGNPNSSYPNSQAPYVRQQDAGGTYLRQDGTPSPLPRGGLRDGDAHIPLDQFIFRP